MSGKKDKQLRREAKKHNIPYWLAKRAYKQLDSVPREKNYYPPHNKNIH
jgi:hypothetical protein